MKKTLKWSGLLLLVVVITAVYFNYPKLNIITGFAAKSVCSCTFVAERDLASIENGDNDFKPILYATNTINEEEQSVTSTIFGLNPRKAIYKKGLGCVLVPKNNKKEDSRPIPKRDTSAIALPFPYGNLPQKDTIFSNINYNALQTAVSNAFDVPGEKNKRTRAVVVVYNNHIVAEQYASGFNKDIKILGWSMTKSITSAVLGTLEREGKVDLNQDQLFTEWKDDERANITLNNLVQMNSGLEWVEDYNKLSDVTNMLFMDASMPNVQLSKSLTGSPNASWNYSSGTTNLLSGYMRNQFQSSQDYMDYWYSALIDKIGMHSMVVETDYLGNFVGSSYAWATARDWSKFGLLYLHNGNWNGEQILTREWVEYTKTPTPTSNGSYGAQFWLNAGGDFPGVPKDMFSCNGYQGQKVSIIPSKDVVIVRFGLTENPEFDFNGFLSGIISAIE
ncbi:serine hydrolase domain-containing protein [Mangrovimonas aestuarii]|uniref:serine hydrolase domain-containing protein n=1 Tax=Mangrovimonas aestuarii TaxID=3018443 RepID=UPI0023790C09|nr:serine hydrolase [Mangrovimonas aestuarii]